MPPLGLRLAGIDADWVSAAQLPQTFLLLVAAFMYGEIALSPPSPGANDNASGVAAALAVAERLRESPPQALEVSLLFCGAGETTREGARSFLRAHRQLAAARRHLVHRHRLGRARHAALGRARGAGDRPAP